MKRFEWASASTVEQALGQLRLGAVVKAGGVDLLDRMKEGLDQPERVVNIGAIRGLGAIEVGSNETYEIVVTNQGSADGTNIVIECTLPAEQAYVSAKGPTKATVAAKVVKFAPLPVLAPKAKAKYVVVVKGTSEGDVRFKVKLTSDQITSPVEETESTHIYK